MKYINGKFCKNLDNPKFFFYENQIFQEVVKPKSLKTQYELINSTKVPQKSQVIEQEDGKLILVNKSLPKND